MKTYECRGDDRIVVQVDSDIEDIVPKFLENRQRDCRSVMEASAQSDFEAVRVLGHRMKGSGSGFGFDAITEIGQSLERAAEEMDWGQVRKLGQELLSFLKRVEVVYV